MSYIAKTPKPPHYAVVFTSINADVDHTEHMAMYEDGHYSLAIPL
jgi:hypothetical protein